MVIISNMDTQHNIWYLPSESNHVMSTNGKVSHLLIIMLITVPLALTAGALFTLNTILLHILSLFKNYCFNYLKQNWKSLTRPLSQNICINFSDSHLLLKSTTFKKNIILDQVNTESNLHYSARLRQGSDKYTRASWKADVMASATPRFCAI